MTVQPLLFKTYIQIIQNSIGTNSYRNFYALVNRKTTDLLQNGNLSCAFFVTSILLIFGLIKETHCTVDGTIKDLLKNGWIKTKTLKRGSVIVWKSEPDGNGEMSSHIGFYFGNHKAISNSSTNKTPQIHHYTFNDKRKIVKIYFHPSLFIDTP